LGTYELTAPAQASDLIRFGRVPKGATVTNVIPIAGILRFLQGVLLAHGPKTFNAGTIISGLVNVPANAGGVGALTLVTLCAVP
jgi:hypothetical protein